MLSQKKNVYDFRIYLVTLTSHTYFSWGKLYTILIVVLKNVYFLWCFNDDCDCDYYIRIQTTNSCTLHVAPYELPNTRGYIAGSCHILCISYSLCHKRFTFSTLSGCVVSAPRFPKRFNIFTILCLYATLLFYAFFFCDSWEMCFFFIN